MPVAQSRLLPLPSSRTRPVVTAALAIALIAALIAFGGRAAMTSLATMSPGFVLLGFAATALLTGISARRWARITNLLANRDDQGSAAYYAAFIWGRVAGFVLPASLGDIGVRSMLYRASTGVSALSAASGVLIAHVFDAWIILVSVAVAVPFFLGMLTAPQFATLLIGCHVMWLVALYLLESTLVRALAAVIAGMSRGVLQTKRFAAFGPICSRAAGSLRAASDTSRFSLEMALLSIARFILIVVQFSLISAALGTDEIGAVELAAAVPAAQVGVLLGVTPGALGFLEGGFAAAFVPMGVGRVAIATFLLGQRILISLYTVILAILASCLLRLRNRSENAGR